MNLLAFLAFALALSPEESEKAGEKIYQNECGKSPVALVHWNKGEEFGSFGIGHFIWYPEGKKGPYEETLPDLLVFLQKEGKTLPKTLERASCPWSSFAEFSQDKEGPLAREIRAFFHTTKGGQVRFMRQRLEKALNSMESLVEGEKKEQLLGAIASLEKDARGIFALLDYSNFKGTGLSASESYQGKGWGLFQVLLEMDLEVEDPVEAFVFSAKGLLEKRVLNSPKSKIEKRWLPGWNKRLDRYLDPF